MDTTFTGYLGFLDWPTLTACRDVVRWCLRCQRCVYADRRRPEHFGGHIRLAFRRQIREHRDRKDRGGCLLGDREIAGTEPETGVGRREMERDGIMNPGSYSGLRQQILERL